jgi:hypothetical protein
MFNLHVSPSRDIDADHHSSFLNFQFFPDNLPFPVNPLFDEPVQVLKRRVS